MKHRIFKHIGIFLVLSTGALPASDRIRGPLRVHPKNPRYFTDDGVRAVYLTGSHTWANFQDVGSEGAPLFPYDEYLDFMQNHNHNFMRFWTWEQPSRAPWTEDPLIFSPMPYRRTGPGKAPDGLPKFNLDEWNPDYFSRLRERLVRAGEHGIYTAVMLFQGFSLNKTGSAYGDPWITHPYNPKNNIQKTGAGVLGIPDEDGKPTLHSLLNADVLARQEAYAKKVIETVNDLDNVLYEIINEGGATDWQIRMIDFIHRTESGMAKRHPVGMTNRIAPAQYNRQLFASPADWISPAGEPQDWLVPGSVCLENYREDPPTADGTKVVISDTDHLWGHGGNAKWVWKSFCRGLNTLFMDPWWPLGGRVDPVKAAWIFIGGLCKDFRDYPDWEPVRDAMGQTARFAERIDLASMTPRNDLASTRYCLARPGKEYLVYFPEGGPATIDLLGVSADFRMEWFIPSLDRTLTVETVLKGGDFRAVTAPFTGDAVLYLTAVNAR